MRWILILGVFEFLPLTFFSSSFYFMQVCASIGAEHNLLIIFMIFSHTSLITLHLLDLTRMRLQLISGMFSVLAFLLDIADSTFFRLLFSEICLWRLLLSLFAFTVEVGPSLVLRWTCMIPVSLLWQQRNAIFSKLNMTSMLLPMPVVQHFVAQLL